MDLRHRGAMPSGVGVTPQRVALNGKCGVHSAVLHSSMSAFGGEGAVHLCPL